MVKTNVTLSGWQLDNPVIPASGTFGYGYEFAELYDINCLGSFSFKGTTRQPRFGNPLPRIAECGSGMLNSVGLQNPGVEKVIAEELPRLKQCFHKKVIANVSGFSVEEYAETCALLDREEQVGLLEVNISCPNVHDGGMSFGTSPASAAEVTRAVKAVTKKPVYMKLSPNVTDIVSIAKACEDGRWSQPDQHADGDALGSEDPPPHSGQRHRRNVRPGHLPSGGPDGLSGV